MKCNEIKLGKNNKASLYTYILDEEISFNTTRKWPCMIILPGGGYVLTATKEGEGIATKYIGEGYSCFVLRYSTLIKDRNTQEMDQDFSYPDPSVELLEAIHIIMEHAEEWNIDTDKIYLNGFSAGCHVILTSILRGNDSFLTKRLSFTPKKDEFKVSGLILAYPMISADIAEYAMKYKDSKEGIASQLPLIELALFKKNNPAKDELEELDMSKYLSETTCPMFIWQTAMDKVVSSSTLSGFVAKAIDIGISVEFHLFRTGPHGLAMSDERYAKNASEINKQVAAWFALAVEWLKGINNE